MPTLRGELVPLPTGGFAAVDDASFAAPWANTAGHVVGSNSEGEVGATLLGDPKDERKPS